MSKEADTVEIKNRVVFDEPTQKNDLETLIEKAKIKESKESDRETQETDDAAKKEKLEALKKEIEREERRYQAVYSAWKKVKDYFGENIKPADLEKNPDMIFYGGRIEKAKQNYEKALSGDIGEEDNEKNIIEPDLSEGAIEEKEEKNAVAVSNEEKIEKNDKKDRHHGEEPPEIIESLKNAKNSMGQMKVIAEFISSGNFKLWKHIRNHESLKKIFNDAQIPDAVKDNINKLPEIIAKEKGLATISIDQSGSIKDYLGKLVNLWNQEK